MSCECVNGSKAGTSVVGSWGVRSSKARQGTQGVSPVPFPRFLSTPAPTPARPCCVSCLGLGLGSFSWAGVGLVVLWLGWVVSAAIHHIRLAPAGRDCHWHLPPSSCLRSCLRINKLLPPSLLPRLLPFPPIFPYLPLNISPPSIVYLPSTNTSYQFSSSTLPSHSTPSASNNLYPIPRLHHQRSSLPIENFFKARTESCTQKILHLSPPAGP